MAERSDRPWDDPHSQLEPDYDFSSRHTIAARLVEALVPAPGRVLDIGGAAGLAADLLTHYDVTVADLISEGVDVIASGTNLPFRDRSFDAAISLDVLEHVDSQQKPALISEAMRIADAVVLAGPYDDEGVRRAEMEQRQYFEAMYGYEHPWLAEHFVCGLPVLDTVVGQLKAEGFQTAVFGSNPLGLWSELRLGSHIAQLFDIDQETWPLRRHLVDSFLDSADATPPSYRHFVVGTRRREVAAVVESVRPGADPTVAATTLDKARGDTMRLLGVAGAGIPELRAHARNLQAGMDDAHKELALRLEIIEGLVEERAGLQQDLKDLREAVSQDRLTHRLVERRLRRL